MSHPQPPLWNGRFSRPAADVALELSGSLEIDMPLAAYDVKASRAHAAELAALGLISAADHQRLDEALGAVAEQLDAGRFGWVREHEDIHMNVEAAVIEAVGEELGGMLQAGRSRNEEIVTDERCWLLDAIERLDRSVEGLQKALVDRASREADTVMPAHTHTQPAQPVLLAHHLLAYVEMLDRDRGRLADAAGRLERSPAGSGAAVGSGLPIDRERVAQRIGLGQPTDNSLDAVSDRDYALETVGAVAIAMGHLSRLAGELVLWSTPYVGFVRLADEYASGSSMLPHKRNPDSAELIRARAARVASDHHNLMTLMHGLPLAYHRDFQETRRPMLEAVATFDLCLEAMTGIVASAEFDRAAMRRAATAGHAMATALAERLVRAGVSFRAAHRRVGRLVALADARSCDLTDLPDAELRAALPELAPGPSLIPSLDEALAAADVRGGTAPARVHAALAAAAERFGVAVPVATR